jgi:hypothetical protein
MEMSTRYLPWGNGWPVHATDSHTTICLENVGASMSHSPIGLHSQLQQQLNLSFLINDQICLYIKIPDACCSHWLLFMLMNCHCSISFLQQHNDNK